MINKGIIPPQSIELEEAILGAIMLEKGALIDVIDILTVESFYKESHQLIFKSILELFSENEPIDLLTVTNKIRKLGFLENVGGASYLTDLTFNVSSASNIEYHARIVYENFLKRSIIFISQESQKEAYNETIDAFDLLATAENRLLSITSNIKANNIYSSFKLISSSIDRIKIASTKPNGLTGVPTGLTELDKITGGWQGSDLIIIAARPAMGKTDLAINLALNSAKNGYKSALFSLEMSKEQLMDRLLAIDCHVDRGKIKSGQLNQTEWNKLSKPNEKSFKNFFIADEPTLSTYNLRSKCRRLKDQEGVQIIIIDYLQLMASGVKGSTNDKISDISRTLKLIAKELNVPVIALSQLSRAVETRGGDKRPMLSDLRDSGAIEQDADIVLFPYRPIYYGITERSDGSETSQLMELDIAKNRSGSVDNIDLRYHGKYGEVTDYELIEVKNKSDSSVYDVYRADKFSQSGINDFDFPSEDEKKDEPF